MPLIIDIKVVPSASKQKVIIDKSNKLKFYLKNPPEKGKANSELIEMLAHNLKLKKSEIEIIHGETTRNKKLKIHCDISYEKLLYLLEIEKQLNF